MSDIYFLEEVINFINFYLMVSLAIINRRSKQVKDSNLIHKSFYANIVIEKR